MKIAGSEECSANGYTIGLWLLSFGTSSH